MENKIPVYYKGEVIGYSDQDGQNIIFENKELWNKLLTDNSHPIYVSSRGKGVLDSEGKVIKTEQVSYDIDDLDKK